MAQEDVRSEMVSKTGTTHSPRSDAAEAGQRRPTEDAKTMGLLDVQIKALDSSYQRDGFAYYMEMGLGKTLTALVEFMALVKEKEVTRLVVICPNSFKTGWVDEINKHKVDVHPHIFESGLEWTNNNFLTTKFTKPPVLIINYEAIRKEPVQTYIRQFAANRRCMIVLDESIQIKTYNSQQTRAALTLSHIFKYKRILSGKPVTQGPHDLWAQMRFIGAISEK